MLRSPLKLLSALLAASVVGAACSSGGATSTAAPAPPTAASAVKGLVTAGVQIGTLPSAPAGWAPPAKITPVNPPPGMFQSTGDAPAQSGAKVRVFFLGMQW
jgi:hypothetical protein